jgi:hypothetical protein
MPRTARAQPRDLVRDWPNEPSADPIVEVARRFAVNLSAAVKGKSIRSVAAASDLNHVTFQGA